MANEIYLGYHTSGTSLFGLILGLADKTTCWNGTAFAAMSTIADADWDAGMIDMTEQASSDATPLKIWVGTFPNVGATPGWYDVLFFTSDAAGSAAVTSMRVQWDGSAVVTAPNDLAAQAIRDSMKLAPSAGDPATGSVDQHLDDIQANAASAAADASTIVSEGVALTAAQQLAMVAAIEAEVADDATGEAIKQAIVDKLLENLPDIDDLTLAAIQAAAAAALAAYGASTFDPTTDEVTPTAASKTGYALTAAYDAAKTAAQAGDQMDLIDAPNATAITAIQAGMTRVTVTTESVNITSESDT